MSFSRQGAFLSDWRAGDGLGNTSDGVPAFALKLYFGIIYFSYLLVLFFYLNRVECGLAIGLEAIVHPLLEISCFYFVTVFLAWGITRWRGAWVKVVLMGIPLIISFVYCVQIYSIYVSCKFISVLALENFAETRFIINKLIFTIFGLLLFVYFVFIYLVFRTDRFLSVFNSLSKYKNLFACVVLFFLIGCIYIKKEQNINIANKENKIFPVFSLMWSVIDYYKFTSNDNNSIEVMGPRRDFVFQKNIVYGGELPFRYRTFEDTAPNVIVIFSEGLSARLFKGYGGKYNNLMPNIDGYFSKFVRVDNYYNHTAATFRGIQGQLASGYPYFGGAMRGGWSESGSKGLENAKKLATRHYQTIPLILRSEGYDSYFLSPHPDSNTLNTMLRSLGCGHVYSAETLGELINRKIELNTGTISACDADVIAALNGFLSKKSDSSMRNPFFIGVYNIGTHAFLGAHDGGKKYSNGANSVLNRFHNFDYEFSKFLDYFFNSNYKNNTILIITSDHAAFPEPEMREAFVGDNYSPYFVDKIPLLIYLPFCESNKNFDALSRTSIDFAPTLLHLLGIKHKKNSFMGRSMFDAKNTNDLSVAAIGNEFFVIDGGKVLLPQELDGARRLKFNKQKEKIELYYQLEKRNKVFEPNVEIMAPR